MHDLSSDQPLIPIMGHSKSSVLRIEGFEFYSEDFNRERFAKVQSVVLLGLMLNIYSLLLDYLELLIIIITHI
jgi:hypothetical protein